MSDLLGLLRTRIPDNAKRVVEVCSNDLPDYAVAADDPREYTDMLDFAVFIRRRTIDLVASNSPLTEDDLAVVAATGERRGETGMSRPVLRRLLTLHASATLNEIQEASGPTDLPVAMQMLAWLGPQGAAAQQAYTLGFLKGQKHFLPVIGQVRQFAEMVLAEEPAALANGRELGMQIPASYQVIVARAPDVDAETSDEAVHTVWHRYGVAATWYGDDFVALVPAGHSTKMISDFADIIGRPFAVGTATGPAAALSEAFALARRVSRVTRAETVPHLFTAADVFIELGAAELPEIDRWLHDLAQRLTDGPDLVSTLDSYYRHDMNRPRTAAALCIHPRSLDYRLQRVHELTGIAPASTHGIRVLSALVSRALSGRPVTGGDR
ncbi:helix-turn-helix domain-containing protein [Kibdelosporangium philippinense]|uniref:Helix-turn-helix domain-containing protein n=1 Tax=Kibdelosporangium philippinense TaxID=211113 RepID=A0ABS8ZWF5_9PSEU|nr:helix-turn-helix domain-containing protein [Kibdelosporangium philippinense]MCE7010916.1 helix-turn-helix domain-containing protein [Kibdelosporangium philippinense]